MKGDPENPFENRPIEDEPSLDENPFENIPSAEEPTESYGDIPVIADEFDRSKLALVSGIGFVGLGIFLYFFVIQYGDMTQIVLSIVGIVVASLVALFYLLDDLTIRPRRMTERGAHFLAGIFLGVLVLLIIVTAMLYQHDILRAFPIFIVMVIANVSVALFLYSMMWEE